MDQLPPQEITAAQIAAHNIRRWRIAAGLTQSEVAACHPGWDKKLVSAAERAADGGRPWRFSVGQLLDFATALGVPLLALFLPPEDEGANRRYVLPDGRPMADLMALIMPDRDGDTPQLTAYRQALRQSVEQLLDPEWGKEVARWLTDMGGPEMLAQRLARLDAVIADLTAVRDAIEEETADE